MVFQSVSTSNSDDSNMNQINDLARTVRASERTQIFKDDAGTRRVLLGKGKDDFYGLKVSPAGTDVYDAADDDLIFNSNQNVFKIVTSGTHVLTRPAGNTSESDSVAHGLSYIPIVIFNVEQTTTQPGVWYSGAQNVRVNYTSGIIVEMPIVTVDDTNVIFSTIAPSAGGEHALEKTFTFKYYLLQETAN